MRAQQANGFDLVAGGQCLAHGVGHVAARVRGKARGVRRGRRMVPLLVRVDEVLGFLEPQALHHAQLLDGVDGAARVEQGLHITR